MHHLAIVANHSPYTSVSRLMSGIPCPACTDGLHRRPAPQTALQALFQPRAGRGEHLAPEALTQRGPPENSASRWPTACVRLAATPPRLLRFELDRRSSIDQPFSPWPWQRLRYASSKLASVARRRCWDPYSVHSVVSSCPSRRGPRRGVGLAPAPLFSMVRSLSLSHDR